MFLKTTKFFQYEVYCKTSDLNTKYDVTAADIFYHDQCHKNYIKRYEDVSKESSVKVSTKDKKKEVFHNHVLNNEECLWVPQ